MKKILIISCTLCILLIFSCKDNAAGKIKSENLEAVALREANAGKLPEMKLDKSVHDFGTILEGTPVQTKFKYTNIGKSMLVVSNIESTCGCTVPKNYKKEVKPGETAEFTVDFNGKGSGKITKTLTLITNTAKGKETVQITANIEKNPIAPVQ